MLLELYSDIKEVVLHCRGEADVEVDKTQKPVRAEVYAKLDMAVAAGLMPSKMSSTSLPSWCSQELLQSVAVSQVS